MNSRDDSLFCYECNCFVNKYCSLHGSLLVIPNTEKSFNNMDGLVAKYTIPSFLRITSSSITGAGLGVYTTFTLPRGVRFGPYVGTRVKLVKSKYCWQILNNSKNSFYVDGSDEKKSNWMRYINCSRHYSEQNLIAYQFRGEIYYSTIKAIPANTELLVYYGSSYASTLNVDLHNYNKLKIDFEVRNENTSNINIFPWNTANASSTLSFHDEISTTPPEKLNHEHKDKPYTCFGCTNQSYELSNCKFHSSTQLTYQSYSCNVCNFKTKTLKNLRSHQNRHNSNCYTCSLCNYNTDVKESLRLHHLIHLPHEPVTCNVCGFKTKNKRYLNKHIKARH